MPVYCYQNERSGMIIEEVFPMGKAPKEIVVNDRRYVRSFAAENKGVPSASGWPLECVASGVNAKDSGKLKSFLNSRGVPTEVSRDGNPIYTDAGHRRKALKARGLFDKSSYV